MPPHEISDADFEAANARGKAAKALRSRVSAPPMVALRLVKGHPENAEEYISKYPVLNFKDHYVVLGEVAGFEDNTVKPIDHYVVLNFSRGEIVPGMLHLNRFEIVPEDEF